MIDIRDTHTLLMLIQQLYPPSTFLRDRYFSTNEATDVFSTDDVLVEYREGKKTLAPFVSPRKGGITILREGSHMERYTPPLIAPRRALSIDDLKKRGFGEALMTQLTPEQREASMIMQDAEDMDQMITRREESMAAEVLLTNGCIMRHYTDDFENYIEKEIRFYSEDSNPSIYTVNINWDQENALILADMAVMASILTSRGLPAADLLVAPDVADMILNNPKIQKLLDLRNYDIGGIKPEALPHGVTKVARLNAKGHMIDVISYEETYTDDDGNEKQYIPEGHVVLTAPAAGKTIYGAVTQLEQSDGRFHTYTGRRIPKYLSDPNGNTRSLTISSSPILMPKNRNPWVVCKVK